MRDGKKGVATLEREFRPAITEIIVAPAPVSAVTVVTPSSAQPSVADELTKLAKLKEAGILMDAEFEAQKQKLLVR